MVICLQRGANNLHTFQLMSLPHHHLLLHYNPEWFNLSGVGLPGLFWKKRPLNGYLTACMSYASAIVTISRTVPL